MHACMRLDVGREVVEHEHDGIDRGHVPYPCTLVKRMQHSQYGQGGDAKAAVSCVIMDNEIAKAAWWPQPCIVLCFD